MAVPKIIQDIKTLYEENDTQDTTFESLRKYINATLKYNLLTGDKREGTSSIYYTNIIPTNWTIDPGVSYISGEYILSASRYYAYEIFHAVDTSASTYYQSGNQITPLAITLKLPSSIMIQKIKLKHDVQSDGTVHLDIQGSNDASNWTTVYLAYPTTTLSSLTEITLTAPAKYQYYRLYYTGTSAFNINIYQFQVSQYAIPAYSISYTSTTLSEFVDGMRMLIQTPPIDMAGVNIITLNGKAVDTLLKSNTRYELVYRSNTDAFYAKEVI